MSVFGDCSEAGVLSGCDSDFSSLFSSDRALFASLPMLTGDGEPSELPKSAATFWGETKPGNGMPEPKKNGKPGIALAPFAVPLPLAHSPAESSMLGEAVGFAPGMLDATGRLPPDADAVARVGRRRCAKKGFAMH